MLPIDPTHDYARCGGPGRCRYCQAILSETPERSCARMTAENRARGLRTAAQHDYTPPDPYRDGLERLRRELPSTRWPETPTPRPTKPGDFTPPDPYQAALDKMRKEQR